ncbi:VOC family protein [Conexibacter sp. JD483]|uniref:VOC family protein n=1 Tax=unclassified Conexibacter TaxID=2627773 RepID=UPI0027183CFA|nr:MULTISPECIES: VOC family protein [unclassified Conexibacter]MDO8187926.1 VOC family protein [Conexibacter sp. CPCC 205706]MDO8200205.1 VOC family protein [Conexibacter sp. CPCC 205762]MDR9369751.1 VOC family protein [Conexibacter sp. JD483]
MTISGFDHVALGVPDLDARVRQLVKQCGMRLLYTGTVQATGAPMAMLADADGIKLELIETPDGEGPRFLHLAFRTDDVDAAHDDAVARGWRSRRPPHPINGDYARTALLSDDRGFDLQVIRYGGEQRRDDCGEEKLGGGEQQ